MLQHLHYGHIVANAALSCVSSGSNWAMLQALQKFVYWQIIRGLQSEHPTTVALLFGHSRLVFMAQFVKAGASQGQKNIETVAA